MIEIYRNLCEGLVKAWDTTIGKEYDDFGRAAEHLVSQAREALESSGEEAFTARRMKAEDGSTLGWYINHPEFYCDIEPEDGVLAVYFRDKITDQDVYAEFSKEDKSQLSDGYHTFEELYEHRHTLCLALMKAMPQNWWFSRKHADGELCFGNEDWFIVGAELPGFAPSSIAYHLPARLWDSVKATGAKELSVGKPWDGHTPSDVIDRLTKWIKL